MQKVTLFGMLISAVMAPSYGAQQIDLFNQVALLQSEKNSQMAFKATLASERAKVFNRLNQLLGDKQMLHVIATETQGKQSIVNLKQSYQGVTVWGHDIVLLFDESQQLEQVYGVLQQGLAADLGELKSVSELQLKTLLAEFKIRYFGQQNRLFSNEQIDTVIFVDKNGTAHHAARLSFFTDLTSGDSQPQKLLVFIDLATGEVLEQLDELQRNTLEGGSGPSGNAKLPRTDFNQAGYVQYPPSTFVVAMDDSGQANLCYFDAKNVETRDYKHGTAAVSKPYSYDCSSSTRNDYKLYHGANSPLNDAHYHAQLTSLMYEAYLGHKPYFERKIIQNVHYGLNMDQAFYENGQVYLGDGDFLFYPMVALDVVAHEISHGFTEEFGTSTPKSMLTGQARAINEAFSDMAGEAAEFFQSGSNDWKSNHEAYRIDDALRYFADPRQDGSSIAHVNDYDNTVTAHHGAGVFNKAFYHLATANLASEPSPWNTKYAFILFANANKACWLGNSTYVSAADCVFRQTSVVRDALLADNVKKQDGNAWQNKELKNHVRKAFAQVGINLQVDSGLETEFAFSRRFLAYQFNNLTRLAGAPTEQNSQGWQWTWDFGDNSPLSHDFAPAHEFNAAGEYTVTLTATAPSGETDVYSIPITVNTDYCAAQGVNFDKYYLAKVTLNELQKNSGSASYSDHTADVVTLKDGNTLRVALTAGSHPDSVDKTKNFYVWLDKNDDGLFDKNTELVLSGTDKQNFSGEISIAGAVDKTYRLRSAVSFGLLKQACGDLSWGEVEDYQVHLVANHDPVNLQVQVQNSVNAVQFNNQTLDARVTSWRWQFGDGLQSSEKSPRHQYRQSGTYQVELRALDRFGDELSRWQKSVNFQTQITPKFEHSVDGKTVTVNGEASVMPLGSTAFWEFGDGATSTQLKTSHTYADSGDYPVKLTIRHQDGNQSVEKTIAIGSASFKPQLSYQVTELADGRFEVVFDNQTTKPQDSPYYPYVTLAWLFGDGSAEQIVSSNRFDKDNSHIFAQAGNYSVRLKITYSNLYWETVEGSITIPVTIAPTQPVNYCQAQGFTDYEHIAKVTMNNIGPFSNNEQPGVVNPDQPIKLYVGQNNTYRIEAGYAGADKFAENYHIWIDFNQDGQFGDGDWRNNRAELVVADFDNTTQDYGNGYVQGTFQLPANPFSSGVTRTRMRILQYYDFSRINSIDPCSDYRSSATSGSGEIEDYLVEIIKN
ncbi:PKD domain-containing protein [Pseudoalteromonas fenneropenaei]|uniref:PKD domain-containing protein n=1 Tax=Pseudoalteromonas fenneropenaei TaxID=1737459 RepID=A0ABV7CLZ4_9GAMM